MRNPAWASLVPTPRWPVEQTPAGRRTVAAFRSSESDTWGLLAREVEKLAPRGRLDLADVRIGMAYQVHQLTADGTRPRAHEHPAHPGVLVTFESAKAGELRYACDAYYAPGDNLRAIAKTLEALRAISRWRALDQEQYQGSRLAIESGIPLGGSGAPFDDEPGARRWLAATVNSYPGGGVDPLDPAATLIRKAQRVTHPDHGGDPEQFRLVSLAATILNRGNV